MVAQPNEDPGPSPEYINASIWTSLIGDFTEREALVLRLTSDEPPKKLTHSVYEPLWALLRDLAAILVVDREWLPESSVRRKRPEYNCEAFQRLILDFIISNREERFMTCLVGESLRQVEAVPLSQAHPTAQSEINDSFERGTGTAAKRPRLEPIEVGCVCTIFECRFYCYACRRGRRERFNERGALVGCILGSVCIYVNRLAVA